MAKEDHFPTSGINIAITDTLDTMLGDADKSIAQTPGTPTVEKIHHFPCQ